MARGKNGRRVSGMILQIIVSALCVLVGALLLFVPDVKIRMLCYIFCAGLIVTAVVEIAKFFLSEAYAQLSDYSFAVGVLCLILGICGLLRIDDLEQHFELYLGFVALATGTVILQEMVQLKVLDNLFWILLLIFNTVILAGAIMIIVDVQPVLNLINGFTWWVLFIAGIASLLSLLITAIVLYLHRRKRRLEEEPEEDDEACEDSDVPDSQNVEATVYSETGIAHPADGIAADMTGGGAASYTAAVNPEDLPGSGEISPAPLPLQDYLAGSQEVNPPETMEQLYTQGNGGTMSGTYNGSGVYNNELPGAPPEPVPDIFDPDNEK